MSARKKEFGIQLIEQNFLSHFIFVVDSFESIPGLLKRLPTGEVP
jgi:hypothetical protein